MGTEMWKVTIKNNGISEYFIEDLGIGVPSAGTLDFHEQFTYDEITGSDDLRFAVSAAELVINDGIEDLPVPSGVDYLQLVNTYHLEDEYYNKIELQTSGESEVHWDNITNTPAFTDTTNSLDEAYDKGGPGAGRTIDVDSGAVQFTAETSGYAPIELTEQDFLPTQGLDGGQLSVKNGILYAYDSVRSKWLSVQRMFITFGRKGKTKNQYIDHIAGPSNNSGYRLARNATIVSITGQLDTADSCDIRIRKNDDTITNITSLNISSDVGNSDITINTDLNSDDYLQSYVETSGNIKVEDPLVVLEIAWRE